MGNAVYTMYEDTSSVFTYTWPRILSPHVTSVLGASKDSNSRIYA